MSGELSEAERQSLVDALHQAETTGGFWGEHPECQEFADVVVPVVARIKADAIAQVRGEADLRQRLYVALVEQRVIDSQKYGEAPYAPITWEEVDRQLADPALAADRNEGEGE